MLNKKILKSILNVKHTAIDGMKILPDGSFAIMVYIRPKAHNVVAASAEGRLPITTTAVAAAHGAPAIGTTTRSISLRTPLVYVAQSTASSRRRSHGRDMDHGSRGNSRHLPHGLP